MRGGAWLPLTVGLWGSPVPVSEELHSARELMEFTSANSNAKAWRGSPNPTASSHRGLRSAPQGSPGPAEATTSHLALPWGARRQGAADVASWGSEAVLQPLARPRSGLTRHTAAQRFLGLPPPPEASSARLPFHSTLHRPRRRALTSPRREAQLRPLPQLQS